MTEDNKKEDTDEELMEMIESIIASVYGDKNKKDDEDEKE